MIVSTLVLVVFLGWFAITEGPGCFEQIGGLLSSKGADANAHLAHDLSTTDWESESHGM